MDDQIYPDFAFYSARFGVDPAEVEETNPYMFGREPATWLAEQLRGKGYQTEVVAEDWGWCVMCQRQPFRLFIGCVSGVDDNLIERAENPSSDAEILWQAFVAAEAPILKRLFGKLDTEPSLAKLTTDVRAIVDDEPSTRIASEEEIAAWEDAANVPDDLWLEEEFQPVSRWISIPLGLVTLPVLAISTMGAIALIAQPVEGYEVVRPVAGVVILLLILLVGSGILRMIAGRPGAMFPPLTLRIFALLFLAAPVGALIAGSFLEHPLRSTLMSIINAAISYALWQLANQRKAKIDRLRNAADERSG